MAIHLYHDQFRALPPSGIVGPLNSGLVNPRSGTMFSWVVLILPQIEQSPLYSQFDFNTSVAAQRSDPQATRISGLLCPSDTDGGLFVDAELTRGKRFAKGNYAAFVSSMHTEYQHRFPGALALGAGSSGWARFRDGTSNTLMLSEVRKRFHVRDQRGVWALPWNGSTVIAFDMHSSGASGYRANRAFIGITQPPNNQGPNLDILYACPNPVGAQFDRMPCNTFGRIRNRYLSAAPRSRHSGGVNVAYADGRVDFLSDSVDQVLMANLISIDDGQVAAAPGR